MNRMSRSLAMATAAIIGLGGAGISAPTALARGGQNSMTERVTQTSTAKTISVAASVDDTRGLYGGGHKYPGRRRFVGKAYRASVRQHQRHARKLRNRKAAR